MKAWPWPRPAQQTAIRTAWCGLSVAQTDTVCAVGRYAEEGMKKASDMTTRRRDRVYALFLRVRWPSGKSTMGLRSTVSARHSI